MYSNLRNNIYYNFSNWNYKIKQKEKKKDRKETKRQRDEHTKIQKYNKITRKKGISKIK